MPPKETKKPAKKAKKPSAKTRRYTDYPKWKIKKFQSLQRRRDAGKKKKKVELFGPGAVKGPKAKELYQKRLERDKEAFEKRQSKRQERMRAEYLKSHPNLKPDDVAGKLFHKEKRPHRIFPHVQAKRAKVFECAMILDLYSTSEIVIEVLDARDPVATRCPLLEAEATNNGKKLIRILNKADLVPQSLVELWIQYFSTIDSHPTLPLRSGSRRPLIDQALDPFGRDSVSNHPNPKDGFPEYNQLWSKPMNIPIPRRKRLLEAKDMSRHVQNEENYIGFDAVKETVIKLGLEYRKEHPEPNGQPVRAGVFGYAGTGRRTLLTYFVTKHEEEIGPKPDPPKWDVKERKIVPLPPQTAPKNTRVRRKLEENEYARSIGHVLYDETLHEQALELGITSPNEEPDDQHNHPVVHHKTIPFHEKVVLCIAPSTIHEVKDPLSMRGLSTEHSRKLFMQSILRSSSNTYLTKFMFAFIKQCNDDRVYKMYGLDRPATLEDFVGRLCHSVGLNFRARRTTSNLWEDTDTTTPIEWRHVKKCKWPWKKNHLDQSKVETEVVTPANRRQIVPEAKRFCDLVRRDIKASAFKSAAAMIQKDWKAGLIPFYTLPPGASENDVHLLKEEKDIFKYPVVVFQSGFSLHQQLLPNPNDTWVENTEDAPQVHHTDFTGAWVLTSFALQNTKGIVKKAAKDHKIQKRVAFLNSKLEQKAESLSVARVMTPGEFLQLLKDQKEDERNRAARDGMNQPEVVPDLLFDATSQLPFSSKNSSSSNDSSSSSDDFSSSDDSSSSDDFSSSDDSSSSSGSSSDSEPLEIIKKKRTHSEKDEPKTKPNKK